MPGYRKRNPPNRRNQHPGKKQLNHSQKIMPAELSKALFFFLSSNTPVRTVFNCAQSANHPHPALSRREGVKPSRRKIVTIGVRANRINNFNVAFGGDIRSTERASPIQFNSGFQKANALHSRQIGSSVPPSGHSFPWVHFQ